MTAGANTEKRILQVKVLATLGLMASVALPMSRGMLFNLSDEYNYALDSFDPANMDAWLVCLAFLWPLPMTFVSNRARKGWQILVVICECMLLAWSIYTVEFLATFLVPSRGAGSYLAFASLAVYGATVVWQAWKRYQAQ